MAPEPGAARRPTVVAGVVQVQVEEARGKERAVVGVEGMRRALLAAPEVLRLGLRVQELALARPVRLVLRTLAA